MPLYVDAERQVVHSEYQARKKNEGRRLRDAQKVLLNPAHPASRFSVGSLDTLRDREQASARSKLMTFYHRFYSANIMTLAVVDSSSLDAMEKQVREKFSNIANYNIAPQGFDIPYFNQALNSPLLLSVPEEERNTVSFYFPIPSTKGGVQIETRKLYCQSAGT